MVGGREVRLGSVRVKFGSLDRDYGVLVLTSLDGEPLESSSRLLLAAVGSAQNQGMQWNADRTSVGTQWGRGPAMINGVAAELELPWPAPSALSTGVVIPRVKCPSIFEAE